MIRLQPSIYAGLFVLLLGVPWSATFAETDPVAQSVPFSFTSGAASWTAGLAIHMEDQNTDGEELDELGTDAAGPSASAANWNNQGTNGYSYLASSSYESGAFVIALNTTGKANINLSWKALTIVNNANVNYLRLQYRVGTSGNFTSLGPANTYTGGAAAATYTNVALPAAANNQSVVQVRWFYFESSSNNRDSLALDNVYAYEVSASAPEISIVGTNKLDILIGDVTPSPADGTDFRAVTSAGTVAITNVFGITNSGTAILNITGVSTSSATAGAATNFVVIAWPATVTAGTVSNLAIRFDPSASGLRTAIVTVANNDTSEASYTFAVQGTGTVPPSVTTSVGTATGTTTATVGGNVTADGGLTVTNRGVCYKTSAGVTIGDNKTPSGTGTGTFTANLTSLAVNTLYYYVAYAQNSDGTTLNGELQFWTWANAPSAPTVANPSSSTLDVTVNENGNPVSTLFSIQTTNSSLYVQTNGTLGATEHWQTDAAWGVKTVTGLSPSSNYGFRVRSQNGVGVTSAWSAVGNATTSAGAAPPSVTTSSGTATGTTTATVGGNVTADGGATVTNRGVCYKTSAGVTIGDNKTQSASGTGPFTVNLTSLAVNTLYYFVAYAQNSAGTALDGELNFWTWANAPSAPTVGGATVSSLNVTVNENGNPASTLFAIQTTNSSLYVQTNGTLGATEHWQTDAAWGVKTVTGLGPGSNYGFRVRAQNGVGVTSAWSTVANGTTLATAPTVTTTVANPTNATTATAGGNVTADGGATVTNRGVVWASTAAPTVPGQQTTNGTGLNTFTATLTNLTPGATYYYRAFAQNSAGTSYGTEYTLTTPCFAGVVTGVIASVTNSTDFTASWSNVDGASGYALDVSTNASFGGAGSSELFFSEYVEGSSNNKYLEIYNGTGGSVDLAHYRVLHFNGGSATPTYSLTLSGTLAAGDVYVIENSSESLGVAADLSTASSVMTFNGDDAIALTNTLSGGYADIIGQIGTDPGTEWGSGTQSTADNTIRRMVSILAGDTNGSDTFTPSAQWDGYAVDTVSGLGSHTGGSSPSYVAGYSNLAVSGTSQSVSGLEQGKAYYFRVRATNVNCTTANSSTGSVTTLVTAAPEMAILGTNLAVILDNDVSPSLLDGTDFGSVSTASVTKDHIFTVTNIGTATLTLSNIVISGAASADYTVQTALSSSSLAPGATTTFTIRFDPSVAGARAATITLANNDSDENPYNFDLTGTGVAPAPEIAVLGSNLALIPDGDTTPITADGTDFGPVSVASGTASSIFTITNSGNATLTITGVTTSGAHRANFRVTSAPVGTVAAGATTTFTVQFDPSAYGGHTGILAVASDDSDEASYDFVVRGDGVITLPEALDNVSLVWTTRGHAVWFGQAPTNHDGVDAAQSGFMGIDSATSILETVVFGPGTIDFWWQVSSEATYDKLHFQVDGVSRTNINGAVPWSQTNFAISSGTHTLQWAYVKDSSQSNGADAGWVDQVTYTVGSPISGFTLNGAGTNLTDAQIAVTVTVRVNIADADGINWNGASISPQPNISPYLSISNPAGGQIVAPVAFTSSGHTDGETATTVTGVVNVSSITTGAPFRVNVVYADNAGNAVTGEFAFAVTDDDIVPPQVSDLSLYGITSWSAGAGGVVTNINTGFEDADGWADQSGGNWTEVANDGSWISTDCYALSGNTRGGVRKIGFNQAADALQMPPVDSPTTVSAWLRLSGGGSDTLRLEYKSGSSWVAVSNQTVNSTTYSQFFWTLSNSGVTTLRFYAVSASSSIYMDDVQVLSGTTETWPKSTLAAGDLFINGFNADGNDDFSFLTLVDIAGSTEIRFTDYGWTNGNFTTAAEGVITYTAPANGLAAGTVVLLTNYAAGSGYGVSAGSAVKSGGFDFSGSGDQLLAYQVAVGSTSFIFALSTDSTNWNATSTAANYSEVPTGLSAGLNAIHTRNDLGSSADINCGVAANVFGSTTSVLAQLRLAGNWSFTEAGPYALSAAPYASGVVYDGVLTNGGFGVTATVYDVTSGLYRDGASGARYSLIGADGAAVVTDSALIGGLTSNGAARSATVISASGAAPAPASITLGVYTALVNVTDYDLDRTGDSLSATGPLWFAVRDDDTNAPVLSSFSLSGGTTNFDLGLSTILMTGLVGDVSAPASSYYNVMDASGTVMASGSLGRVSAPPTESFGYLAIIGFDSSAAQDDEFSFVVLKSLAAGTRIVFTDRGYDASDAPPYFRSDEGTDIWVAPDNTVPGSVYHRHSTLTLSDQGDQIFALTNDIPLTSGSADPGFLYGVNFNGGGAPWQGDNNSENDSTLPTVLSNANYHVDVTDHDAAFYSGLRTGTVAQIMAAIANTANWTRIASGSIDLSTNLQSFTVLDSYTGTISALSLNCGQDYTVRVVAVDADADRPGDQLGTTGSVFVMHTIGAGTQSDYPTASNLLVSGAAAAPATTVFDSTIRTGGWSLAFSLSHPVGVFTNAASPSFRLTNSVGPVFGTTAWSNGVRSGQTYFFTNANLPGVAQGLVVTGLHYVVWSASNQGSCVASIVDRSVFGSGTNVFTVVDDDTAAPVLSGFTVGGAGATVSVDGALSGFAVTGLVQDVGSGVALASAPPYALFYSLAGAVIGSNTFTGGTDGAGKGAPVALTNWFSGLTLACGNSYTVRVFVADADNDRANDGSSATGLALVVATSGAGGEVPTARDLLVNNTAASVVSLTDQAVFQGGWTMALTLAHATDAIVTNGASRPAFTVYNATGGTLYAGSPLSWSNLVRSGQNYYATNTALPSADSNLITTGSYSVVWSAQSDGLCFGSASGNSAVSPGTNRFTVVDDDTVPPNLYGLSVAGGTGTGGGGGGGCPDPAATNLNAGDIAIFAMNTKTRGVTNNDSFAFVTLKDLPTGTRIKFTDNGWKSSGGFRSGEGILTWMTTSCVPMGTVVRWISTNHPTLNHGVMVSTNGSFAPNIEGEQILAYQGSESAPNFIYALNDRLGGVWDVDAVDSHSSAKPIGLDDGSTCVAVGEFDNVIINTNNLAILGDREQILNYIGATENWIGEDDHVYDLLAFNFTFPDAGAAGGTITDHDILVGGWSITGLVQDVGSGVAVSNGLGLRYTILNTNGGSAAAGYFTTTFTNGSKLLNAFTNGMPAGVYADIQLGLYTALVAAADTDADRVNDAAERITNVPFVVVDDDVDPPQIGTFTINGLTTLTNAAELVSVVISGQVRDLTSGIAFGAAPPTFEVLNNLGSVAASGSFAYGPVTDGAGVDWTNLWTAPMNLAGIADCGIYTVRVMVADADDDRPNDRRITNQYFLIQVASGNGDAPTASNLLVQATPASVATLTDAELGAGGWSLAITLHHPAGLQIDAPYTPTFALRDPTGSELFDQTWSNIVTASSAAYATNEAMPAVPYGSVRTGYHAVVWSGRSQGGCFGLVSDSADISDTNQFLVVDDDTVGPSASTNFTSSAAYWTNQPVITFTWETGSVSDASGVQAFRLSTNSSAPVSAGEGFLVGLTNAAVLTNLTEGIHTNWLFALDADDDRANDSAMGAATSAVIHLDFTAPAPVASLSAAPGAADDTSQIDLSWTPVPDAGNPNLSPWHTYRVYYTQDGGDPTTNDTYVDAASYPELGTNTASAAVIQGLVMGSEYRVAMAGLDRAGNLGPLSDPQAVTLGQIVITQAYANAQSQPVISWIGSGGAFYDVIYADDTGYSSRVDSKWKLAKTVSGTSFTDEGGIDDGDGQVRLSPMAMPENLMRFYRVSAVNSWIPASGRAGGANTQIIVALKSVLSNGYNFVGMGMTPMVNTLGAFLGTNRLPADDSMATSAVISVYEPTPSGDPQPNAWWLSTVDGWRYEVGSALANTQALPYPFTGYNVLIPTNILRTNLLLVGRVPWTNHPSFTLQPLTYHIISLNTPRPTKLSELGLRDLLVRGSAVIRADEIRILNRGDGPWGSPRYRFYVNTSGQFTYASGGSGSAENHALQPDDAIIVYTRKLASPVTWNPPTPYEFPRVQITNTLSAAPSVLAQAPLSITATSAVLRGLVNPNSLATVARIQYGPTTGYGSTIAVTNFPATNVGLTVSGPLSGLSTGTVYYFQVWASNSAGVSRFGAGSFTTLGLCTSTPPAAPTVTAAKGASTAQTALSWGDAADEAGYTVYRHTANDSSGAAAIASLPANATTYQDTAASAGQLYYYWLKATNCAGASVFGAVDTGFRKLATVAGVNASYTVFTNKVRVAWDATAGATGYGLWRHTADDSGSATYLASVGAGVTTYDDLTAIPDTDYYYWVRATNSTSASLGDFPVSGVLGRRSSVGVPELAGPTAVSITATGAVMGATVTANGGSTLTARGTVWGYASNPTGNMQAEGGTALSTFSHARSGMTAGTLVYYRGWASNSAGLGYSTESSFWTVPAAPYGLHATNSTTNGFTILWGASPSATNYLLDISSNPSFTVMMGAFSNKLLGAGTNYVVAGLPSESTNYWRLRAQNSGGVSTNSASGTAYTLAQDPWSQASNVVFSSVGPTNMVVTWSNGTGQARMLVGHKDGPIIAHPLDGVTYTASAVYGAGSLIGSNHYVLYRGSGASVAVNGLQTNSTYYFRVYEYNGSGSSLNYLTNNATGNPNGQGTLP